MSKRLLVSALALCLSAPLAAAPASQEAARQSFVFYDGVIVTAVQQPNGNITAFVRTEAKGPVRGSLHLDIGNHNALWTGQPAGGHFSARYYDLSAPDRQKVLRDHTLRSAALSALLHYEDEQDKLKRSSATSVTAQSCQPVPNGCSNWPDACGGISTRAACDAHDACYQCALGTRRECDRRLFDDVVALTHGDYACASTYYVGVRLLGWLVYQDPTLRPYLGPDMYSLGLTLNACEGYEYLCTTYVF